jgi:transcription antitermination factor NusA-like protein
MGQWRWIISTRGTKLTNIATQLALLTFEELKELSEAVHAEYLSRNVVRQQTAMRELRPGIFATFVGKGGRRVTVIVDKFNIKTVSCHEVVNSIELPHKRWKVSPTLLTVVSRESVLPRTIS